MIFTKAMTRALLAAGLVISASAVYGTTVTQLSGPSQLSSNDTQLGIVSTAQPVGYVSPGNSISFFSGDRVTFSRGAGQFEVDQAGVTYGDTAFANNTYLVGAGGFQGGGDGGPITITFTTPVIQFGVSVEDFNATGFYAIVFQAFDTSGANLGSFSSAGNSPLGGTNGNLSFEGLTASNGSIAKITFDDTGLGNNLIFGNLDFAPVGTALQAPPTVTPEPSSIFLLGTGLVGMAGFCRSALARSRNS